MKVCPACRMQVTQECLNQLIYLRSNYIEHQSHRVLSKAIKIVEQVQGRMDLSGEWKFIVNPVKEDAEVNEISRQTLNRVQNESASVITKLHQRKVLEGEAENLKTEHDYTNAAFDGLNRQLDQAHAALKLAMGALVSVVNSAVHPETAIRSVLVPLDPIRKAIETIKSCGVVK